MSNVIEKEEILLAEIDRLSLKNKTGDAITLTQQALKSLPRSARLNRRVAEFHLDQKLYNLAEIYSSIAYKIDKDTHTLILLITSLAYQGKFSKAIMLGANHMQKGEKSVQILKALEHIKSYLKPLLKNDSATLQERVDMINIYKACGEYDKASAHIERLPNFSVQQQEKEKLCKLWTAHLIASMQKNNAFS